MADPVETNVNATALAQDGGAASRKMWLTVATMLQIVALGLLACVGGLAGLGANLPTLVGGLLGALGLYTGGNVVTKFAAAKASQVVTPKAEK